MKKWGERYTCLSCPHLYVNKCANEGIDTSLFFVTEFMLQKLLPLLHKLIPHTGQVITHCLASNKHPFITYMLAISLLTSK